MTRLSGSPDGTRPGAGLRFGTVLLVAAFCGTAVFEQPSSAADRQPTASGAAVNDPAQIQRTVQDVLADPEYRHLFRERPQLRADQELPGWLERFLDWLFGRNSRGVELGEPWLDFGRIVFYLAMGVLVVLLIVLLAGLLRRMELPQAGPPTAADAEAVSPTQPPGDLPANEYERRALQAAAAGDYRSPRRELVLGAMSWTERTGLIRYRRGLTNRDYIRAVWRQTERRESLMRIVAAFERVFYGRRPAEEATFADCLKDFR
jgi:hypothetical protein